MRTLLKKAPAVFLAALMAVTITVFPVSADTPYSNGYIVFFGDSWAQGWGADEQGEVDYTLICKNRFSTKLVQDLGLEESNYAQGGPDLLSTISTLHHGALKTQ